VLLSRYASTTTDNYTQHSPHYNTTHHNSRAFKQIALINQRGNTRG